jgi:hypothetical protein
MYRGLMVLAFIGFLLIKSVSFAFEVSDENRGLSSKLDRAAVLEQVESY